MRMICKVKFRYPFRGRDGSARTMTPLNPYRRPDSRLHLRQRSPAMTTPAAEISDSDWQATPAGVRTLIMYQQQEIQVSGRKMSNCERNSPFWRANWSACRSGSGAHRATPPNRPPVTALDSSARTTQRQWPKARWPAGPAWIWAGTAADRAR